MTPGDWNRANGRPVVAVLTPHWESKTERGWITRQVAGALSCAADVHVISPEGAGSAVTTDSVFTVHWMGTPIDPQAEIRRDLLVEAASETGFGARTSMPSGFTGLVDRDLFQPWEAATDVLGEVRPDVVVIAGHRNVGAMDAVEAWSRETPVILLALVSNEESAAFPRFADMFTRSSATLAVTQSEWKSILEHHERASPHRIGAPLAANPSVLDEPNTWVGDNDTILVLTGVASDAENEQNELARLLRLRFPDNPVGIVYTDAFDAWHRGRVNRGWAVARASDLARLMAWARVTVHLRPGQLFARRCVESLLYGTPIVVPSGSRAQGHAARGQGGLWFTGPAELTWCVEALLDAPTNASLAKQGRSYAETEYGSTKRFIERVVEACGLREKDEETEEPGTEKEAQEGMVSAGLPSGAEDPLPVDSP